MEEGIIIEHFGPIVNRIELNLKKVNIIIGDQSTGKSTVAKLIVALQNTYFREIFDESKNIKFESKTDLFREHLKIVGLNNYLKNNTEIEYYNKFYKINFRNNNVEIETKKEISLYQNLSFNFNYIPCERNTVVLLGNNLFALIETGTRLPSLLTRFGDKFIKSKARYLSPGESLTYNFNSVLDIEYRYKNEQDYIVLNNGQEIDILEASTGIQNAVPLLMVFKDITSRNEVSHRTGEDLDQLLVIEEPELDLFPETQYKLVKHLFSGLADYTGFKNQLLITTHSPYILSSLNNLMFAHSIGQRNEAVKDILHEMYWVNPKDVSAYIFRKNGKYEDIMDYELDQIKVEKIDEISEVLSSEWHRMVELTEEKK